MLKAPDRARAELLPTKEALFDHGRHSQFFRGRVRPSHKGGRRAVEGTLQGGPGPASTVARGPRWTGRVGEKARGRGGVSGDAGGGRDPLRLPRRSRRGPGRGCTRTPVGAGKYGGGRRGGSEGWAWGVTYCGGGGQRGLIWGLCRVRGHC